MSVCVGSAGPIIGLGSTSGMSLPHHHHQHMPGLLQPLPGGVELGNHIHHPSIGQSVMPVHLFQPPQLLPPATPLLGTMDSQCPETHPVAPITSPTALNVSLDTTENTSNTTSDVKFPNPDMLLALIARNKGLEGELVRWMWIKAKRVFLGIRGAWETFRDGRNSGVSCRVFLLLWLFRNGQL